MNCNSPMKIDHEARVAVLKHVEEQLTQCKAEMLRLQELVRLLKADTGGI